jgi:ABC-type multidrug transport system ATPase subunit
LNNCFKELALYGEFSITEALEYFAQIYGMSKDQKKKRINWLIEFLELPDPLRKVGVLRYYMISDIKYLYK